MTDDTTLTTTLDTGPRQVSTLDRLADIPEEEIWLQKQKSLRTRRAYGLDVQHFMRTLAITAQAELRQADHKAVIAWERFNARDRARGSLDDPPASRGAVLSLQAPRPHDHAARNPVGEVERPAINRDEGATLAFAKAKARKMLDAPAENTIAGLRDSRDPLSRLAGWLTARRDRGAQGRRPASKPRLRFAARLPQGRPARRARDQPADCRTPSRLSGGLGPRRRH
jgi:hypothetical protein